MTNSKQLSIGFSPCPNDTFIFGGLATSEIKPDGFSFQDFLLEDVETLNLWALLGKLDVTKLSFHAMGHILDDYVLLNTGCALGRNCGPLLVCGHESAKDMSEQKIAIPGKYTTAALLMKLCYPQCDNFIEMRFDKIMSAISEGIVDAGVIIHESRFTYKDHGLQLVRDLGDWWEGSTGHPIPLGGIVARRSFDKELLLDIEQAIRKSMIWAFENRTQSQSYIKKYARELEENVIADHINLYVNDYTADLGERGRVAVMDFLKKGNEVGAFKTSLDAVFVE